MGKLNPENSRSNFLIRFLLTIKLLAVIPILLTNTANAQYGRATTEAQKPDCFAKVGNISSRNVQKKTFTTQEGVVAYIKVNASHWEPIIVNSFSLIILRDSSVVFQWKNNGNRFDSPVRSAFQHLQSDDVVLIYSIHTRLADKKTVFVTPLEFRIEE